MRHPRHAQRGVAAVEMAIILIPMLVLCFGITELGRALYQYNGLVKSVRGAVRYLSQQSLANPSDGETADGLRLKARSLALCGDINCSGKPALVPNLTLDMISVCDALSCPATHANVPTGEGTTSLASVRIGAGGTPFPFTSLVPWVVPNIAFGPITVTMVASTI
ncbi:MAG: pilus assembly protein [Hydrogenophaga sp.]|nr:pilus assembly protein [Hydrogenophaga sp.]